MKRSLKLKPILTPLPLLILLCLTGLPQINAQSISWAVVNSFGHIEGDDARLEWTMGEPLTTEVSGSTGTLRVGFFPFVFSEGDVTASKDLNPEIEISIFPNPASSVLWVHSPGESQKTIRIVSLNGATVLSGTIQNKSAVNIESLPSGPYVLYVIEGTGSFNSKTFIKS